MFHKEKPVATPYQRVLNLLSFLLFSLYLLLVGA